MPKSDPSGSSSGNSKKNSSKRSKDDKNISKQQQQQQQQQHDEKKAKNSSTTNATTNTTTTTTKNSDMTMTIPRKKDKDGAVLKKAKADHHNKADNNNSNNNNNTKKKDAMEVDTSKQRSNNEEKKPKTDDKSSPKNNVPNTTTTTGSVPSTATTGATTTAAGTTANVNATTTTNSTSSTTSKQDKIRRRGSTGSIPVVATTTTTVGATTSSSSSSKQDKIKRRGSTGTTTTNTKTSMKKQASITSPLKIDTSVIAAHANTNTNTTATTPKLPPVTPSSGTAMDNHPFARGSVIEVLHGIEDPSEDHWWSEDSDDEDNEKKDDEGEKANKKSSSSSSSVRLCDIIDRKPLGDGVNFRYYVHYRDFNRRMDEWISMDRIVSPPSVGNAKARAIKKEEERQKRKQQRLEEKNNATVDLSAPRASRRRSMNQPSSTAINTPSGGTTPGGTNTTAAAPGTAEGATTTTATTAAATNDSETPRRTRLQRRKSFDDDQTVVTGSHKSEKSFSADNNSNNETTTPIPTAIIAAEKGVVAIPTAQAAVTHTIGEHVVATIPAQELDEHEGLDEASLREHEEVTKVKNVSFIELGAFQMETWYFSPLPKELLSEQGYIEVLYVCEFTLNLFSRKTELQRFQARLPTHRRHPPGNEIYRNGNISMFEVDGFEERIYCQNLCYIAKLFLDHKTLYFDVDPFLFYVLCEVDERGFHPVGYYSKEKYSDVGYNLACILTFPCHQRKGYGRFLIAFSYELSKKEEKVGSPEKPMSDLGQQAYKPYWASTIVDFLLNQSPDSSSMSIMDISKITSIMAEDIVFTLNQLGILKIINGVYFIAAEEGMLKTLAKKYPVKEPRVDPSKLHWTPFVTEVKRDKFSIHSKKPSVEGEENRGSGGF